MRRLFGFPILAIGLTFGVHQFLPGQYLPDQYLPELILPGEARQPAVETEAARRATEPEIVDATLDRLPLFAAPHALVRSAERIAAAQARAASRLAADARLAVPAPVKVSAATSRVVAAAAADASSATETQWRTVTLSSATAPELAPAVRVDATKRRTTDRYELARDIQRELKRVGCYGGAIDGSWGAASKRAMIAFMDRVNASLPLSQPDSILLTLISSQRTTTCGETCPAGQSIAANGRCLPNAILARAMSKDAKRSTSRDRLVASAAQPDDAGGNLGWIVNVRPARDGPLGAPSIAPLPGRMTVGGPKVPLDAPAPPSGTRTAALDDGSAPASGQMFLPSRDEIDAYYSDPSAEPEVMPPASRARRGVTAPQPQAAPPRAARREQRSARRSSYGARSVQSLFTHPLGRF